MKKFLIKLWLDCGGANRRENALCIKFTQAVEEGQSTPEIGVTNFEVLISVKDYEVDYEQSGKLWFNDLELSFSPDGDETKCGVIAVKVKDVEEPLFVNIHEIQ